MKINLKENKDDEVRSKKLFFDKSFFDEETPFDTCFFKDPHFEIRIEYKWVYKKSEKLVEASDLTKEIIQSRIDVEEILI